MKKNLILTLFACASFGAQAGNYIPADGFINIPLSRVKIIEGVFHYCDRPNASQDTCYDETIRSSSGSETQRVKSIWRDADAYIKYSFSNDFNYVGMTASSNIIYIYYMREKR